MRKPILAGNWKMYKTVSQATSFVEQLQGMIETTEGIDVVLCAPFTALGALVQATEGTGFGVGAQNVHQAEEGAYTGEVSSGMLKDLGVQYVIIGHSERRQYFGETDESVNAKAHAVFKNGLLPIICCGEDLTQREQGITNEVVERQVRAALNGLSAEQIESVVIAYEPIWAIGTGKTATAGDANEVCAHIRHVVRDIYGTETGDVVRIQYGGSVKPDNIEELMAQSDIDGALVGGASLEPASFAKLVQGAQK